MQTMHNQNFSFYRQCVFTLCENIFAHCFRGRLSCAGVKFLATSVPILTILGSTFNNFCSVSFQQIPFVLHVSMLMHAEHNIPLANLSVCLTHCGIVSVCLSVCLTHCGIVSK